MLWRYRYLTTNELRRIRPDYNISYWYFFLFLFTLSGKVCGCYRCYQFLSWCLAKIGQSDFHPCWPFVQLQEPTHIVCTPLTCDNNTWYRRWIWSVSVHLTIVWGCDSESFDSFSSGLLCLLIVPEFTWRWWTRLLPQFFTCQSVLPISRWNQNCISTERDITQGNWGWKLSCCVSSVTKSSNLTLYVAWLAFCVGISRS